MIRGLFEVHISVENLEISSSFYKNILKLKQCYFEEERRIAFFWIGQPKNAMLGLWEKPKSHIEKQHFAFTCDKQFILNEAVSFLKAHQIIPYNFLNNGTEYPIVFSWMPALSIYFNDPDGHCLEFIAILEGKANPNLGIITYKQWINNKQNQKVC